LVGPYSIHGPGCNVNFLLSSPALAAVEDRGLTGFVLLDERRDLRARKYFVWGGALDGIWRVTLFGFAVFISDLFPGLFVARVNRPSPRFPGRG